MNAFEAQDGLEGAAMNKALTQARNAQDDAETYRGLHKSFPTSADLEAYIKRLKPSQSNPHDEAVLAAYKRHEARKASEAVTAKVRNERRTYTPDGPYSFVQDLARSTEERLSRPAKPSQ